MERIEKLPVEAENQIDFGGAGKGEGLMLAGDQNIVDTPPFCGRSRTRATFCSMLPSRRSWSPGWPRARCARLSAAPPPRDLHLAAGRPPRTRFATFIQRTLDGYRSGVLITGVQLEKADPPSRWWTPEEVQRAEQNQNKLNPRGRAVS